MDQMDQHAKNTICPHCNVCRGRGARRPLPSQQQMARATGGTHSVCHTLTPWPLVSHDLSKAMHAFSTPLRSLHWTTCIGQAAAAARPKPGPLPAQWETDLGILSLVVLARVPDSKGGPTQVLACQEKPGGRSTAKSHAKRLLCAGHPGGGERRGGGEGEGGAARVYISIEQAALSSFFTQILSHIHTFLIFFITGSLALSLTHSTSPETTILILRVATTITTEPVSCHCPPPPQPTAHSPTMSASPRSLHPAPAYATAPSRAHPYAAGPSQHRRGRSTAAAAEDRLPPSPPRSRRDASVSPPAAKPSPASFDAADNYWDDVVSMFLCSLHCTKRNIRRA